MPELPEVETFRRTILTGALGKEITGAEVNGIKTLPESLPEVANGLIGRKIVGSKRNGKSLFLELDDHKWLLLHFGMSGVPIFYYDQVPRYARLTITFTEECLAICWQRRLGAIALLDNPESFLISKQRGPDALDIDWDEFHKGLKGKRAIKTILMDQSFVSGVGNLYADEILFQNHIRPDRKANLLTEPDKKGLFTSMGEILRISIEKKTEFSSFPSEMMLRVRNIKCICPKCGGKWSIMKVGGRTSYFCPECQR